VAVLVFTAHIGFVYFDDAHEFLELGIGQSGAQAMAHEPRCPIGAGTDHPMDLKRADALLAGEHQIQNLKPNEQLIIRVLKNRPADDTKAIVLTILTQPMERPRVELVDGGVAASRALNAIRPAAVSQVLLAGIFVRKELIKLRKRHLANEFWFTFLPRRVHEKRIAQMDLRVKSGIFAKPKD
jgi:hypothetical protein